MGSSKLFDLAAAAPLMGLLGLEIAVSLPAVPQTPQGAHFALAVGCAYANLVFSSLLIILLIVRRLPLRKTSGVLPRAVAISGFLLPMAMAILPRAELTPSAAVVSTGVILVGTVAATVASLWLGRSFSILPQARGLVTSGPYRFVRHPLYLAELIVLLGAIVAFAQPWAFFVLVAAVMVQLIRIGYEERILTEAFPAYANYASQTARLVPGIY